MTNDKGASMIEYALLVSLIAVLALTAVMLAGARVSDTFDGIATQMDSDWTGSDGNGGDAGDNDSGDTGGNDADPGNPGDDDSDNPGNPGGNDLDPGNPGGDDPGNPGGDDPGNPGGDDPGNPGGNDPIEPGQPAGEEKPPGSTADVSETGSEFYWWNDTKQGGEGQWKASVTFDNGTQRHQYLDLEIVLTDDKGKKTTVKVSGFYVPANGSATYVHWSNDYKLHNGKITGTMTIEVKVIKIATSDQNWKPVTYDLGGVTVATVDAPTP